MATPETPEVEAETALVPAGPGDFLDTRLALTNPTALREQLDAYAASRQLFLDWLFSHLVSGTDFMVIHRKLGRGQSAQPCPNKGDPTGKRCEKCGGKATLCKPGTEKICGLLRLRPRFRRDQDTWEMLGAQPGVLALVCELVNQHDQVVAEGRGARNTEADYGDVNKSIKMLQKSAQTDAVLRCAGLSEVFTQDLEDMVPKEDVEGGGASGLRRPRATTAGATAKGIAMPSIPMPLSGTDSHRDFTTDYEADEINRQLALTAEVNAATDRATEKAGGPHLSATQRGALFAALRRAFKVAEGDKSHWLRVEADLRDFLGREYGVESLSAIPVAAFNAVSEWAQSRAPKARVVRR